MNLSDYIAGLNDLPMIPVEVPEWPNGEGKPVTVHIRIGSAGEVEHVVQRIEAIANGRPLDGSWRAWMLSHFLCDENGNKLFPGESYKKLSAKSFKVIRRLHEIAAEANGMRSGDAADEQEEDVKKKSDEEANDSGSDYL